MPTVVSSRSREQMNRLLDHHHVERVRRCRGKVKDEEGVDVCGCVKGKKMGRRGDTGARSGRKAKNKK